MQIMEYSLGTGMAHLTAYIQEPMPADPEDYRMPAVVVFPGGGYEHLAPKEGEPIAMEFAAAGISDLCIVLQPGAREISGPTLGWGQSPQLDSDECGTVACGSGQDCGMRIFGRWSCGGSFELFMEGSRHRGSRDF